MLLSAVHGMGIMDRQPTTDTPDLHMVTPPRPTGIGILITDRGTIPVTGTVVTMEEEYILTAVVIIDIRGKENALLGWHCRKLNYISPQVVVVADNGYGFFCFFPEKGTFTQDFFGVVLQKKEG